VQAGDCGIWAKKGGRIASVRRSDQQHLSGPAKGRRLVETPRVLLAPSQKGYASLTLVRMEALLFDCLSFLKSKRLFEASGRT
jgi:hypothetical protein